MANLPNQYRVLCWRLWRMRRHGPVIAHCTDSEDFLSALYRQTPYAVSPHLHSPVTLLPESPLSCMRTGICDNSIYCGHGRRSRRRRGDKSPPEFGVGGLSPQILSCCKILSTRLLALQCRKMCFLPLPQDFYSKSRHAFLPPPSRIPVRSTPMTAEGVRYRTF